MNRLTCMAVFLAGGGLAQAQAPARSNVANAETGYYQTKWHTASEMEAGEASRTAAPKPAPVAKPASAPAGATVISDNSRLAEIPVIRGSAKRSDVVQASAELPALPMPLPDLLTSDAGKPPKAWLQKPVARTAALAVYPATGHGPITATGQDGK